MWPGIWPMVTAVVTGHPCHVTLTADWQASWHHWHSILSCIITHQHLFVPFNCQSSNKINFRTVNWLLDDYKINFQPTKTTSFFSHLSIFTWNPTFYFSCSYDILLSFSNMLSIEFYYHFVACMHFKYMLHALCNLLLLKWFIRWDGNDTNILHPVLRSHLFEV